MYLSGSQFEYASYLAVRAPNHRDVLINDQPVAAFAQLRPHIEAQTLCNVCTRESSTLSYQPYIIPSLRSP